MAKESDVESDVFSGINLAHIEDITFTRENLNLKNLRIVTHGHQYRKTTEDKEVYVLKKWSSFNWKTI